MEECCCGARLGISKNLQLKIFSGQLGVQCPNCDMIYYVTIERGGEVKLWKYDDWLDEFARAPKKDKPDGS